MLKSTITIRDSVRSLSRTRLALGTACLLWTAQGCHHAGDPTPLCYVEPPEGTLQSALFRVSGGGSCGTGGLSVTSVPVADRTFTGTMRFRVRGALPRTVYYVQRAAEMDRPQSADGVCQRAEGRPPWTAADGPVVPAFVTFPFPLPGEKLTLSTDDAGDAAKDFEFHAPFTAGTQFDVAMRLVDDESAPASELRSGCMTVLVR